MTISTKMYAQALFEISEEDPMQYLNDLDTFLNIYSADEVIKNYFLKTYNEFDIVSDILKKQFSNTFINFLEIVYENRVFKDLANVRKSYEDILVEKDLMTLANVVSAKALSEKMKNQILAMVKSKYRSPIKITYEIDKNLISGFMIRVNSDIYDTSVKSKLDQIKNLEVQ